MPSACGGLWGLKFGHTDILGRPGDGSPLGRPGARGGRINQGDLPLRTPPGVRTFRIAGISRDANGNPLGACTVMLFETGTDRLAQKVVSDAGGVFGFSVSDQSTRYYAVFYRAGVPDVSGATVNTLVGS